MKKSRNPSASALVRLNTIGHFVCLLALAPHFLKLSRERTTLQDYVLYTMIAFVVVMALHFVRLIVIPRLRKTVAVICESALWMLLIVDAVLVAQQGVHLDSPSVVGAFDMNDFNFGVVIPTHLTILAVLVTAVVFVTQRALYTRAQNLMPLWLASVFHPPRLLAYSMLLALGLLFLETQADFATVPNQAVPLYQSVVRIANGYPNLQLKLDVSKSQNITLNKKPDILMIMAESFRFDLLTSEISPNLVDLAKQPGCFVPQKAYAGGHQTFIGAFTFLYGSESYLARPFFKNRRNSPALSILRDNGYKIYGSDASGIPSYNPQVLQLQQFDAYDRHDETHTAENDIIAIEALKKRLESTPVDQPTFGFLFFYGTHHPYYFPANWPQLKFSPVEKGEFTQSFYNYQRSANFVDQQVADTIRMFRARAHDRGLIIVFAGDHGEEFGERGSRSQGHAAVGFGDHRIRIPLIACFPPGTQTKDIPLAVSSDILPSIFHWAGVAEEKLTTLFTGKSFFSEIRREQAIISGAYFPTEGREFAVLNENFKIRLNFSGTGPATSQIVVAGEGDERLLTPPYPEELSKILRSADQEFHRYLEVEGSVAAHATSRELTPTQY